MAFDTHTEKQHTAPVSRRAVVTGAGAATAAVVLGACATYGSQPATPGTSSAGSASGGTAGNALAKTSEIPVGGGKIFEDQAVVVTQAAAGQFAAFSTACTHQSCSVSTISGGTINCPCHGSKFKLDGSVAKGPASSPLEEKSIQVQGDSIILA